MARTTAPEVPVVACDIPLHYRIPQVRLRTDHHPQGVVHRLHRRHDANLKRNVALLLARWVGWDRVLLFNDDVRGVGWAELNRTLGYLNQRAYSAAGWAFPSFPDNSVVCHARRLGGQFQDTFVSDGMLGLRRLEALPFFPAVYNEDWIFLFTLIAQGQLAHVGDLWQLPYDPFVDPNRARFEEFGDLLGEGLMETLHGGLSPEAPTEPDFWSERLAARQQLLTAIEHELSRHLVGEQVTVSASAALQALRALAGARHSHEPNWPESLAGWVRLWQADLRDWRQLLGSTRPVHSVEGALAMLGLRDVAGEWGQALRA